MEKSALTKCILLYSGGLDSLIAAKVLMEQGIEITGLQCILPYYPPDLDIENLKQVKLARTIGLKLVHYKCGDEYINMLKNPKHGYGKEINPCIDCKIFFLKQASMLMHELGADFVATGEVVGQRPMSQLKHTLIHIEKEADLVGRLIRPLSAKIMQPSIPELEGKVDRNRLLDISGRGRKRQLELASYYGITDFELPAGGCLFTDRNIAARIKDSFRTEKYLSPLDLFLLKTGRHFRLNNSAKIIVARNKEETDQLEKYMLNSDYFFTPEFSGPSVFARGELSDTDVKTVVSIIHHYGKPNNESTVSVFKKGLKVADYKSCVIIDRDILDKMRI